MKLNFFDCVIDKKDRINNFFEEYFYLDGISGKLGSRLFKCFDPDSKEVKKCKPHATLAGKIAAFVKILSYLILPIPAFMLLGKGINRCVKKYRIVKSSSHPPMSPQINKNEAEKFLTDLSKKINNMSHSLRWRLLMLESEFCGDLNGPKTNPLDQIEGNLSLLFKDDPEVFFCPKDLDVSDLNNIINVLSAAFTTSHKMVVTHLSNYKHGVAAAFMKDGNFKIIDSMLGSIVEVKKIEKALNAAHILDDSGQPIKFKGDYVNTMIQKGGNQCLKFSHLYCYQMAKTKTIEAYKQVHGAFLDGKLKSFEDYPKIEGSREVSSMLLQGDHHTPFMRSWAHRCVGFKNDDWRQTKLRELFSCDLEMDSELDGEIGCFIIKKNGSKYSTQDFKFVLKPSQKEEVLIDNIQDIPLEPIHFPEDYLDQPLSKFLSKNDTENVVFFFGKDPLVTLKAFKLPKHLALCQRLPPGDWNLNN